MRGQLRNATSPPGEAPHFRPQFDKNRQGIERDGEFFNPAEERHITRKGEVVRKKTPRSHLFYKAQWGEEKGFSPRGLQGGKGYFHT